MPVKCFYRLLGTSSGEHEVIVGKIETVAGCSCVEELKRELCFYVDYDAELDAEELKKLSWIIAPSFEESLLTRESILKEDARDSTLIEIGPRLNFSTAFSTNAASICHSIGLSQVSRIEYSTRYMIRFVSTPNGSGDGLPTSKETEKKIVGALHDPMTQCRYFRPITSFKLDIKPEPVYEVDVLGQGRSALEKVNKDLGLAFDDWDLDYYTKLFSDKVNSNPTSVECFDLAQSNSEHSRHWFFKGRMVIDGEEKEDSLFKMVMKTQENTNSNNVVKFCDNSSVIEGYNVKLLYPEMTSNSRSFQENTRITRHILLTAETHNFPTGVAPFPGATTGTGGRIRDVQATGTGAHVIAAGAGYCFGNLNIPGYKLPWEDESFSYPENFAPPLEIAIEASNGASDYGNKFGEPVLTGFARSFGMKLNNGERREWVKPIMFSSGLGSVDHVHTTKQKPEKDMLVVKIGGPIYRIGVGGGAASSIEVQGDNEVERDFGAVQRGDAEMGQKLNRVIRSCIEMLESNPICSIHDQGAGGNGNVLKEIVEPAGAVIQASEFQLGDPTISVMELWGAEYQESNAVLIRSNDQELLTKIAQREKCPVSFVGNVTGDGKIRLEVKDGCAEEHPPKKQKRDLHYPVDLDLECVLGSMPRKVFKLDHVEPMLKQLSLPESVSVTDALDRVLRLPSVASKRYLTNKVDRSVTGLVAQQQCVGPLHTPLADVAVIALSHFDKMGAATAIGEQPIKGLVNNKSGARMSVGEALTNLVFARISDLKDVKCSGNWMWPAKLPGEGAALYDACTAMCDIMKELGIAVDGGKDSLSMAGRVGKETVKAPGALVITVYAPCPDITATVTPDLKCPAGKGSLLWIDLGSGHHRLGGSALAQCYNQLGDVSPDVDDAALLRNAFNTTQKLITERKISSGHDISDGGLITCILEMAFAGNYGIDVSLNTNDKASALEVLFAEELGLVLEVSEENVKSVCESYQAAGVTCSVIGSSHPHSEVNITLDGNVVLTDSMTRLRDVWEETSFRLERLQCNPHCVEIEESGLKQRRFPPFKYNFDSNKFSDSTNGVNGKSENRKPCVAVIREEGSNGDREMVTAFHMAGFQVWDVNMQDLCNGSVTLDRFQGVVFVGGFSYADVFGSAKGWGATLLFHPKVRAQFDEFYARNDTFSLGVCNGCQLMALLGWVAPDQSSDETSLSKQGLRLYHNKSGRFESRFSTVAIEDSSSIMLKGMEGSVLGIWVAHGEGQMQFKNETIHQEVEKSKLIPMRYVDDDGKPTDSYPFNPNGSPGGAAAVCSKDGRHLAMMPHPERCVLPWQWPWMPQEWNDIGPVAPWFQMFKNAYNWCTNKTGSC